MYIYFYINVDTNLYAYIYKISQRGVNLMMRIVREEPRNTRQEPADDLKATGHPRLTSPTLLTVTNFQNNGKIWILFVDKALLSDGKKNTVQAKQWLEMSYSNSAPSETMIKRWFRWL